MIDYRLDFSEAEIKELFKAFDINHDNIAYNEFLRIIRGKMSDNRKQWVMRAFAKLDKDGSGILEIEDLKGTYSAKFHPDVLEGKKTEDEILFEFLETFETHHNILMGKPSDS